MRKTMNYRQFAWIVGLMLVVFLAAYWIIGGQLHARREKENAPIPFRGVEAFAFLGHPRRLARAGRRVRGA